ncbi:MAG: hypothetical protein LBD52_07525 [Prevotellaceae bacterium]|jgi:hypothetical protein|nr:hypothetical protein [Prevotellaceae bacterium]
MKVVDKIKRISGTLHLTAYDAHGVELWSDTAHNLIVATGYNATAEALAGVEGARIQKIAVGANGTAPQATDTEITGAEVVNITNVEYPAPATVRFNFMIDYGVAVGMPIREFGLLTADGRLFSRKTREAIDKTEHMSIVGAWDIHM